MSILNENCFYLFEASGAEFTITETNGSILVGNEIFGNQIGGENQYILLKASASTSSTLFYKNLGFPNSYGEINIIPYLGFDLLKMQNPQPFAKYGSSVEIGFEGEILIGAPGFNNNEGLIEQISFNDEDNYSHEFSISSPLNGNVGFGSSISTFSVSDPFDTGSEGDSTLVTSSDLIVLSDGGLGSSFPPFPLLSLLELSSLEHCTKNKLKIIRLKIRMVFFIDLGVKLNVSILIKVHCWPPFGRSSLKML